MEKYNIQRCFELFILDFQYLIELLLRLKNSPEFIIRLRKYKHPRIVH